MEFKKFSAGPCSYGKLEASSKKQIENVNFEDPLFDQHMKSKKDNYNNAKEVLLFLALCHSIIIDERNGKYNASSPDELALVNGAKFLGASFDKRDEENNLFITFEGKQIKYRLLNILEFTSSRKRMSVVI